MNVHKFDMMLNKQQLTGFNQSRAVRLRETGRKWFLFSSYLNQKQISNGNEFFKKTHDVGQSPERKNTKETKTDSTLYELWKTMMIRIVVVPNCS